MNPQVPTPSSGSRSGLSLSGLWFLAVLAAYVLSTGPVSWATNDGYHDRYLPDELNYIYLPLTPLLKVEWINKSFYFYTAVLWDGFPAGYTTL